MLFPDMDDVSSLLSTLELWNILGVATFGEVLVARSDAGFRSKTLRIRWFAGCKTEMAPLARFVDKVEFYHVTDKAPHGLKLPKECMERSRGWEP